MVLVVCLVARLQTAQVDLQLNVWVHLAAKVRRHGAQRPADGVGLRLRDRLGRLLRHFWSFLGGCGPLPIYLLVRFAFDIVFLALFYYYL